MYKLYSILLKICFICFVFQACKAQNAVELQNLYSTEIIGTWQSTDEIGHKLEFTANGVVKIYAENEFMGEMNYSIEITCKNITMSDERIFLKLEEDGEVKCEMLEAVNKNNSQILAITTEAGKLQTYKKL